MIECGRCGIESSDDLFFCQSCGTRLFSSEVLPDREREAGIAGLRGAVQNIVAARRAHDDPLAPPPVATTLPPARRAIEPHFRLVSLNGDGSDGEVHALGAGPVDIGRTSGHLVFDDPFLAGRHARIAAGPDGHILTPLEKRNGVYRRLRGPAEVVAGDRILIGRQLLLFEDMPDLERAPTECLENGLAVFGSRTRPPWGRLLQLTPAGIPRDVYHLGRGEVVVGRERTDLVFSDDELVSTKHAKLSRHAGRVTLEDLSSLNGTFLSLREPTVLVSGDVIRMGSEVFRFEN